MLYITKLPSFVIYGGELRETPLVCSWYKMSVG